MRSETATWKFGGGRSATRRWPGRRRRLRLRLLGGLLVVGVLSAAAGCGGAGEPTTPAAGTALAAADPTARLSELKLNGTSPVDTRPYQYKVPSRYDAAKPTPLLILLHGFGASGSLQELYFNFSALAEKQTFLYAYPDGKQDPAGLRYWNAMEWCCDFFKSGVDDVAYIKAIIDDMSGKFNVDPKRVFIVGHSNGGFMAHRLACELSDKVAGIVSLEEAMQVICAQSRLLRQIRGRGTMGVVALPWHKASQALAGYPGRLWPAIHESPDSTVVAGEAEALAAYLRSLQPPTAAAAAQAPTPLQPIATESAPAPARRGLSGRRPRHGRADPPCAHCR